MPLLRILGSSNEWHTFYINLISVLGLLFLFPSLEKTLKQTLSEQPQANTNQPPHTKPFHKTSNTQSRWVNAHAQLALALLALPLALAVL